MIKSSAISELLKHSIEKEIDMVFISRLSGEILCSEKRTQNENELIPDILSLTFSDYMKAGEEQEEKVNLLLIENENCNIVCSPLYDYFLAMIANKNIPLGKLKLHLNILKKNLETTLDPFKEKFILQKKEDD